MLQKYNNNKKRDLKKRTCPGSTFDKSLSTLGQKHKELCLFRMSSTNTSIFRSMMKSLLWSKFSLITFIHISFTITQFYADSVWYSHTGGLEHVADRTLLLVLQQFKIKDIGQQLALVFKIFSPQHGPCARVQNLELVPTDNKLTKWLFPAFSPIIGWFVFECKHKETDKNIRIS